MATLFTTEFIRERAANSVGKIASSQKHVPGTSAKAIPCGIAPTIVIAVVSVLILLVFWQVGGHAFLNFDDAHYASKNPMVARGLTSQGVVRAFTTFDEANWHHLTRLSHMSDVQLFGLDAGWLWYLGTLVPVIGLGLLYEKLGAVCAGPFWYVLEEVLPISVIIVSESPGIAVKQTIQFFPRFRRCRHPHAKKPH